MFIQNVQWLETRRYIVYIEYNVCSCMSCSFYINKRNLDVYLYKINISSCMYWYTKTLK